MGVNLPQSMKLAAAFRDRGAAEAALERMVSGVRLQANREDTAHLPFDTLLFGVTDVVSDVVALADVGTWLVCERTIKHRPSVDLDIGEQPGIAGVFTMVANPALTSAQSDAHWREVHAPLALDIHEAMTHYYQLSVQHCLKGPDWNGFALCCFASEDDLRDRFFRSEEGERLIAEDVAKFADTRNSPRRVIAHWQGR